MTQPYYLRGLREEYFEKTHLRRQVLRDAELELRPVESRDFDALVERVQAPLEPWMITQLASTWERGRGCAWLVHAPEPVGLAWALRVYLKTSVEVGGVRLPGVEALPGQGARTLNLVAAYVRDRSGQYEAPKLTGDPYVAIPCEVDQYIEWAKESGLPWALTREPEIARVGG